MTTSDTSDSWPMDVENEQMEAEADRAWRVARALLAELRARRTDGRDLREANAAWLEAVNYAVQANAAYLATIGL